MPFTKDYELFKGLAELGKELTELHLMKSGKLNDPIAKFQGSGSNVIAKSKKSRPQLRAGGAAGLYQQRLPVFRGHSAGGVGVGYQVLDKWLYDRRERKLSNEEIQHYCKVTTTLHHTIELQKEIDGLYAGVEEDVVEM